MMYTHTNTHTHTHNCLRNLGMDQQRGKKMNLFSLPLKIDSLLSKQLCVCVCVFVCVYIIYITVSPRWVSTLPPFLQEDSGTCLHKTLNQIHGHFQKSLSSVSTNIYLQAEIMEDHGRGTTQFTVWAACQGRLMQLGQSSFSVPLNVRIAWIKVNPDPVGWPQTMGLNFRKTKEQSRKRCVADLQLSTPSKAVLDTTTRHSCSRVLSRGCVCSVASDSWWSHGL